MAFIPVPNTVELCFVFSGGPKPIRVCINITSAVAWTIAAMQGLAADVVDAIVADGLPWVSNALAVDHLHLQDLSSSSAPAFDWITGSGSNTLPFAGTDVDPLSAGQAALVTTLRTTNRGRSFRGRNYWPGIGRSALSGGGQIVGPTRVTDQDTFVNSLAATIHALPARTLVVVSRHTGGAPRVTGITTPVSSHDTNNIVDTQRRRVQP